MRSEDPSVVFKSSAVDTMLMFNCFMFNVRGYGYIDRARQIRD